MTIAGPDAVPSCEIRDLSYRYGSVAALHDISIRIQPGESVALIGPSGAGKTTLLRLTAGLFHPKVGVVHLMGHPIADMRPGRKLAELVGMMQQQLDLIPQLAVKHNVQAGYLGRWGILRSLAALALPIESPSARDAARRVGLEDRFTTRVGRLSGGEQQRVALARLVAQDPYLYLADEPVSALDPALADDLLALLREVVINPDGDKEILRTVIGSVHQPELALRHFDRVIALKAGRIAFDKPSDDVSESDLERLYELGSRSTDSEPETATR